MRVEASAIVRRAPPLVGLAAPCFAVCAIFLAILFHPDFNPAQRFVSEFGRGPHGGLVVFAIIAYGTGLLAVAHALQRTLQPHPITKRATRSLAAAGALLIIAAFLPSDLLRGAVTMAGVLHNLLVLAALVMSILSFANFTPVFAVDPRWQRFQPYSAAYTAVSIGALGAFFVIMAGTWLPTNVFVDIEGLGEQTVLVTNLGWIMGAALEAFRIAGRAAPTLAVQDAPVPPPGPLVGVAVPTAA